MFFLLGLRPGISCARNEAIRKSLPKPSRLANKSGSGLIVTSTILIGALAIARLYLFMGPSSSREKALQVPVAEQDEPAKKNETSPPEKAKNAATAPLKNSDADTVVAKKEPVPEPTPELLSSPASLLPTAKSVGPRG